MSLNIIDFPPELLEKIFRYLSKANDRRRVAQVCRTFYRIVRGQSKKFGALYLTDNAPNKSPVQVFKNSTFPFSKVYAKCGALKSQDKVFWLEHGEHITELTMNGRFSFRCLTFFPNLKKLKLDQLSELLIKKNAPKIQLPVEELCINSNMNTICYILQRCPSLKSFELSMGPDHFKRYADLLPWIESIETVKVDVEVGVQLKEIVKLPTKVVLQDLHISAETNVESISSFFNKPRLIETLSLEFGTKGKILPLLKAGSIKKLVFSCAPDFPKSFDILAQVPGLQEIDIDFWKNMIFLPRYWSSTNSASKIHHIGFPYQFNPKVLSGLNTLSSLKIGRLDQGFDGNLEVVRNHLKLKTLEIRFFNCGDAELEPISSLHDLEILELNEALNVTSAAFKTIIKFPKLKRLAIHSEKMEHDVAVLLPENCPNLEELELDFTVDDDMEQENSIRDSLNDAQFEHLIRALPYLKEIEIRIDYHSISQEKVQQMQTEFPYLKINVRN